MKTPKFATEADLCAAFIAWVGRCRPDVMCYAEWAGWDILLVYPEGWQVGIQAKLRLNAGVMLQAAPDQWHEGGVGPDYRAVLVPESNGYSTVAKQLGLVVFHARESYYASEGIDFLPEMWNRWKRQPEGPDSDWLDWNPTRRHELPPVATDAIAGSPCPVTLTPWKLGALDVLAELEVKGSITPKRIRQLGIDPRRWTQYRWLLPAEERGVWVRGDKCPPFDRQHPTAYAAALSRAKETAVSA